MKQEIIEVGVVAMYLGRLLITDGASYFVRPKLWEISPECTKITGITVEDIRTAKPLSKVMDEAVKRFSPAELPCFTWGEDVQMLEEVCIEIGFRSPFRRGMDLSAVLRGPLL